MKTSFLNISIAICSGLFYFADAAVTDNSQQLIVPLGETYTIHGTHTYSDSVLIEGTVYVTGYTGSAGTGMLELICPGITISGQLDGSGRGYRGAGNYQEGPGVGGYPSGGAGYGGTGGIRGGSSGTGSGPYGTAEGDDIQMGSGGGDTGGGLYGGGNGGAMIILSAETLNITGSGSIAVNGTAGLDSTWGAGGASGGGIFISAINTAIAGSLSAAGGRGGNGTWGGGGGAGGRIKVFYCTLNKGGAIFLYNGGAGGTGSYPGGAGGSGTYYEEQVVFDDVDYLYVPYGVIYEMSGMHQYNKSAVIVGQVNITAYNGSADSGQLMLIAPQINVGGTINGNERGYRGSGDYQEGPGVGGYPGGGAGYGGRGGDSGHGGTGTPAYGTTEHIDIDMGSGGGDTGGALYGGGNGGAKIILNADNLTVDPDAIVSANGGAGLSTTWGAGGGSGGGILLLADNALLGGTLSVRGGTGGSGTWGGGGGAGGRIKIFSNTLDTTGGTFVYIGGLAGAGAYPAQPGGTGTLFTGEHLIADLNHDGMVDIEDFAILSMYWLETL